jgi:hypothetical protein
MPAIWCSAITRTLAAGASYTVSLDLPIDFDRTPGAYTLFIVRMPLAP